MGGWAGGPEGFQLAKGEVGPDHYQVRTWPGLVPPHQPPLLAHAFLAVTRAQAADSVRAKGPRRVESAAVDGARGPPAAGRAGLDKTNGAWLGAARVQVAPSSSGPSQAGTLPAPRTQVRLGIRCCW